MPFSLSGNITAHPIALATFWLSLGLLFYIYLGYPLLLRLLGLFIHQAPAPESDELTLSIIIAAHNEERSIGAKLEDTLELLYPAHKVQIIVVSDGSTDRTEQIVRSFASRNVQLIALPRQSGKTHAQNQAVLRATGDILIFSDATTRYHPRALSLLAGNFADTSVGACSGRYIYLDGTAGASAAGPRTYATYDNTIRALQSNIGSITGCCGCIYAVRRSLYTALEPHIISDLVQPLHVLRQGYRVLLEPRALAWEVSNLNHRKEFAMRVRVVARALTGLASVHQLLTPWRFPKVAWQLWSHKLLRWSVPLLLLSLLASSLFLFSSTLYAAFAVCQLAFYAFALLLLVSPLKPRWPLLGLPLYFCNLNAAAVGGFVQYLRGERYTAWRPEREDAHAT